MGRRYDVNERSELKYGAYDFKAPTMYVHEAPFKPSYVFAFDTSLFSV